MDLQLQGRYAAPTRATNTQWQTGMTGNFRRIGELTRALLLVLKQKILKR